jgi:hypothetical protein
MKLTVLLESALIVIPVALAAVTAGDSVPAALVWYVATHQKLLPLVNVADPENVTLRTPPGLVEPDPTTMCEPFCSVPVVVYTAA